MHKMHLGATRLDSSTEEERLGAAAIQLLRLYGVDFGKECLTWIALHIGPGHKRVSLTELLSRKNSPVNDVQLL